MIDVPRSDAPAFEEAPLTWKPVATREETQALLVCSNGHVGRLADHVVHEDGRVEPSVVCAEDGCGFHERVRLLGWEAV